MVYRKKTHRLIDWNLRQYPEEVMAESLVNEYERSNIWLINPARHTSHNAVFPLTLCDQVVRLYSLKGDLVFDPFAGIGTLGKAAQDSGRHFLMIEINARFVTNITNTLGGGLALGKTPRIMTMQEFLHTVPNYREAAQ